LSKRKRLKCLFALHQYKGQHSNAINRILTIKLLIIIYPKLHSFAIYINGV